MEKFLAENNIVLRRMCDVAENRRGNGGSPLT